MHRDIYIATFVYTKSHIDIHIHIDIYIYIYERIYTHILPIELCDVGNSKNLN